MSTAMLSQPATVSIPTTMPAATGPASPTKKRRRRAPATGAAEDCFSCRDIGVKCDRRRPYCGPCLDNNKECKGYRTQLTWGVGVASRGKLRGMSLPVTNAQLEQRRINDSKASKQRSEDKALSAEERAKRNRTAGAGTPGYGGIQRSSPPSNAGKLSIITNYDFVNMEPPSAAANSAASRSTSSTLSATQSSAISGTSPALSAVSLSARTGLPSQRLSQEQQRSPQSGISSPYSAASQPPYHSPVISQTSQPPHHTQQHYQTSPAAPQYQKSPYSHVSMPPQQPSPSMLLSPMSEYEPSFPSHQHYPMSSAPASAPLYDLVTGVSSASYHPSPSMTVTSSGVSYAPMTAPLHAPSRMMDNDHMHHHHAAHHSWNGQNHHVGVGNLHHHHQHVGAGTGNLSDLLYDEDMLGTF
ncbi:hypothetical protein EDC01DRAFT_629821 [Geopyxis carbonaria]|nr:hypothetical protein EDC01DRAFT_629821 [Geopyxis carbonaria]